LFNLGFVPREKNRRFEKWAPNQPTSITSWLQINGYQFWTQKIGPALMVSNFNHPFFGDREMLKQTFYTFVTNEF